MSTIRVLLDDLEDPSNMFPLEGVSRELSSLIDSSEQHYADRNGWYGVSAKYHSPQDEHDLGVVRLLIGSAFVLGQAAIAQSVSIVTRLRSLAGNPSWMPSGKSSIVSAEAPIHSAAGVSEIAVVDAVANYFKHHYEWPSNWTGALPTQQRTIDVVVRLGLLPGREDNLHVALHALGLTAADLTSLAHRIQGWRERLAVSLRLVLEQHGLS